MGPVSCPGGADGEIFENNDTAANSPATKFFWFDGIQQGDVSNNGTSDVDYVQSIARHTKVPGTGLFTTGDNAPTAYADFDASYEPINGLDGQDTAERYTVQDGDTLQSIAQQIWGDSNFWYLIADANGLNGSSQLVTGMDLIIPNKVANVSNSNSTYRVYDPNLYVGDTSPTHPPKPQHHHNCGVFGQVIESVVAIAVTAILTIAVPGLGTFVGAMFAAAIGNAAGQAVGLATGIQSKFNWASVGESALSAGVTGGLNEAGVFGDLGIAGTDFADQVAQGIVSNVVTQGVEVATGLQSKFDWAGVAAAGISQGVSSWAAGQIGGRMDFGNPDLNAAATRFVSGMAGGIAAAASRSLITGTDFGDNIMAVLPNVIGQTAGNYLASQAMSDNPGTLLAQIQAAGAAAAQAPLPLNLSPIDLSSELITTLPTITFDDGAPTPSTNLLAASSGGLLSDPLSADALEQQMGLPNNPTGATVGDVQLALSGEIEPSPEGVPGFDKEAKDFGKDFIDVLGTLFGLKGPADVMGAYARQSNVQADYDREHNVPFNYYTVNDTAGVQAGGAPTVTFDANGGDGIQFLDRNGDGSYDLELARVPAPDGKLQVEVNDGDGSGFMPYKVDNILPPPPRPGTWSPPPGAE